MKKSNKRKIKLKSINSNDNTVNKIIVDKLIIYNRWLVLFILVVFILFFIYVVFNYNNLKHNYNYIESEFKNLNEDYYVLIDDNNNLNNKISDLNSEVKQLKYLDQENKKIITEKEEIIREKEEIIYTNENIINDLNIFRSEIEKSMDWFRKNSNIVYLEDELSSNQVRKIKRYVDACMVCNNSKKECYIKTACIYLINDKELDLAYSSDSLNVNQPDKLLDITTFLDLKKGDCEDIALFYVAELRYLIQKAKEKDFTPIIESFKQVDYCTDYKGDTCYGYPVYENWYNKHGLGFIFPENYIYPYVTCGNFLDPVAQKYQGHCIVMFSNKELEDVSDISSISSYFIEPQNGEFVGTLNVSESDNVELINPESKENYIYQIIISQDIFYNNLIYENTNNNAGKWLSYSHFLEKLDYLPN